ncbi:MAG TPA: RsmE family RNA methyltransferase [Polyangiaceae bacterium]
MKPLRVPVDALELGEQVLSLDSSHYVLRVHRARIGESLLLFDPTRGKEALATLVAIDGKAARCHVEDVFDSTAVPKRSVTLLQAFAKGDKTDRILRDATALGATSIIIVRTARCVPGPDEGGSEQRRLRWRRIAVEAARQCGRGNVPEVAGPIDFERFVDHLGATSLRCLMAPDAAMPFSSLLSRTPAQAIGIFIGPEGGLEPDEASRLHAAGFLGVRFGDFTLRTETAAIAVLGALVDWGS